ncbi:MAG: winged helix-turn-helix domain-containing protein [Steroidobacteraceae bacterium]
MNHAELPQGFSWAGATVRPELGRVEGAAGATRLEPRVMELLVYLARHQGQVVTREAIIKHVWRGAMVTDDVISRSVYRIRKALYASGAERSSPLIETIPKRGYRLVASAQGLEVPHPSPRGRRSTDTLATARLANPTAPSTSAQTAAVPEPVTPAAMPITPTAAPATPAAAPATPAAATATPTAMPDRALLPQVSSVAPLLAPMPRHRAGLRALPVAVTLALSLLVAGSAYLEPPRSVSQRDAVDTALVSHHGQPVIVVLPFVGVGPVRDAPYLSAGLTDDIVAGLGSIETLRVVGPVSAARAQAEHSTYRDMARELDASAVLEGRVSGEPGDLSLQVRLIDTGTGQVLREKNYAGPFATDGVLQASVINDVAEALGAAFHPLAAPGAPHQASPEAYRLFLQARYYAHLNNPGGFQQSHDYLLQAVQIDPQFARAWAALCVTDMLMVDFGNRSVVSATAEAQPALDHALQLQPALPEAQAASGLLALYNGRFEAAAEALRRATALRPSDVQAHLWLGRNFMAQSDVRRAEAAFERAHLLDPQAPIAALNLGLALDQEGRYDAAAAVLQEGIGYAPRFANLYWAYGHVLAERGQLDDGVAAYRKAIELGADYAMLYGQYSILLAQRDDAAGASAALTHAESLDTDAPTVWAARVSLAMATGEHAELLDQAALQRGRGVDPLWADLAAAQIQLFSGNPRAALKFYQDAHLEERLGDNQLRREVDVLGGPAPILDLACAYQMTGDGARAMRLIARAEEQVSADRDRGVNPIAYDYLEAAAAAMRGDETRALTLLRIASGRGWRSYASLKTDPRFNRLHDRGKLFTVRNTS